MTGKIKFTKMHGAGNDYIYVNTLQYPLENPQELAVKWSAPHTGIGSDGLVLIGPSKAADFSMRIFNADGSEAMMCGNASRCIGKYLYENGLTVKEEIALETLSGIKILKLHIEKGIVTAVTVDMDEPRLENKEQLDTPTGSMLAQSIVTDLGTFVGTFVCMGNPHCVIFTEDVSSLAIEQIGPVLERHPLFPERANIEFAQKLSDSVIRMRVWERGSGITQACGTGACATAVAAVLNKVCGRKTEIRMDGGSLFIEWSEADNHVYMTGPATKVFEGEIDL